MRREQGEQRPFRRKPPQIPETIRPIASEIVQPGSILSGGFAAGDVLEDIADSGDGSRILLNGVSYRILRVLSRGTGEADVFLLDGPDGEAILKYYFPGIRPKDELLAALRDLRHPGLVALFDFGVYRDRVFELAEYARGGSLTDVMPLRNAAEFRSLVASLSETLGFCHDRGIVHRDIKPENVFFRDPERTQAVLGDFGISSLLSGKRTRRLTVQAFTVGYAAPELYGYGGRVYVGREVDFFALGMTLIHLWEGKSPFEGLSPYAVSNFTTAGQIRIPRDMEPRLRSLVQGLIALDYRERWGLGEIRRWLQGEELPAPPSSGSASGTPGREPFRFDSRGDEQLTARDPAELADLMLRNPGMGRKHLYRGQIARWLQETDPPLYQRLVDVTEELPEDQEAGLLKAVYLLDPTRDFSAPDGTFCRTPEEVGDALEHDADRVIRELSGNPNAPLYLFLEARGFGETAAFFRECFRSMESRKALSLVVLLLHGDCFKLGSRRFSRPEDLASAEEPLRPEIARMLSLDDSRILVWLERKGILGNSRGFESLGPAEEERLLRVCPWVLRYLGDGGRRQQPGEDWTPLMHALGRGDTAEAERLLSGGEPIDRRLPDGSTALHTAALAMGEGELLWLLSRGAEPDARDEAGNVPLHIASVTGRGRTVRILLEHGADPNALQKQGWTPLHFAARYGRTGTVGLLLSYGADPSIRNSGGRTPADEADARGYREIVELLASPGAGRRLSRQGKEKPGAAPGRRRFPWQRG